MTKNIEELIGKHPENPDFFGKWLNFEDITNNQKLYRKLIETDNIIDNDVIDNIANWLVEHLVSDNDIIDLRERKKAIYKKYSFENHLEAQGLIPNSGMVRQGNLGEIIFIEYLKALKKYDFLVYKLIYNPNVSQSMKGDDILMFDEKNLRKILLGEAKYRGKTSFQTLEEILGSFGGNRKLPLSIT